VNDVDLSFDGTRLLVVGYTKSEVMDVQSGQVIATWGDTSSYFGPVISPDGTSEPDMIPSYGNPTVAEIAAFANQMVCEVEESSDEEVHMQEAENEEVDETVERAAEVADWVEGVLDDAAPKTSQELEELARAGLQKACKDHDYQLEVTFAGLVNFYRWMP